MFPQVGLGEIPVELEHCSVTMLGSFDILLLSGTIHDSSIIMAF